MKRTQIAVFTVLFVLFSPISSTGNPFEGDDCEEGSTPKCPPGYTLQTRKDNRFWCMKYFAGNYTFFEAERICRCQGGGSLSGIENHKELKWVMQQAEQSFNEIGIKNGGVWVGAYRRLDCSGDVKKWINKTECTKDHQFQWTDRHTIGVDMWSRWMDGSPHNNIIGNHSENCVQLQVSFEDQGTPSRNLSGTFDNKVCVDLGLNSTFITEGFVCGRPAKGGQGGGPYYGGGGQVVVIGAGKPDKKQ